MMFDIMSKDASPMGLGQHPSKYMFCNTQQVGNINIRSVGLTIDPTAVMVNVVVTSHRDLFSAGQSHTGSSPMLRCVTNLKFVVIACAARWLFPSQTHPGFPRRYITASSSCGRWKNEQPLLMESLVAQLQR